MLLRACPCCLSAALRHLPEALAGLAPDKLPDARVGVIFEGAFEAEGVRIRVDILERKPNGWQFIEVKSSARVKPEHLDELAVQWHVITACGVDLVETQLTHIDTDYVRGDGDIDWLALFVHHDVTVEVHERLPLVPELIARMNATRALWKAPVIRPGLHCHNPYTCEFWKRCTADKPADWIFNIPHF